MAEGSFADATVQDGKKYEYRVYAQDDASLKSGFSGSVSITAFVNKTMTPLSNMQAVAKSEEKKVILFWEYPQQGDIHFVVYRSVNGSAYQSHKTVKGRTSLEDFGFKTGDVAKYKVKVINSNGWQSDFSNEVSATFSTN
jgi:fibronectin type 3 domain-containing protein